MAAIHSNTLSTVSTAAMKQAASVSRASIAIDKVFLSQDRQKSLLLLLLPSPSKLTREAIRTSDYALSRVA